MIKPLDSVNWAAFTFVQSLELMWPLEPDDGVIADLRLRLINDDFRTLNIHFEGVTDLTLGTIHGVLQVHLFIENIAGDQWENLRYKVTELMDDRLNFYCRTVSWKLEPDTIG